MTGPMNLMGEIGRERDRLPIPGFCDIVMRAAFADSVAEVHTLPVEVP